VFRAVTGIWKCAHCSVEARATVHQMRKTYCSMECMAEGYKTRLTGAENPNYRGASEKVCQHCGGGYQSHNPARKFCSPGCYVDSKPKVQKPAKQMRLRLVKPPKPRRPPRAEKPCIQCGTKFKFSPSQSGRLFCSYQCHLDSGGAFRAGLAAREAKMKYGPKKDANHNEIFEVLQKMCATYDLSALGRGVPDGIAWVNGAWHLFDVKNPKTGYGRRGMNPVQRKWLCQWGGGPIYLIYTIDDAIQFAKGQFVGLKSETPESAAKAIAA